ncbi:MULTISPECIES: hypothetical protein [unclassified Paenibacillus]
MDWSSKKFWEQEDALSHCLVNYFIMDSITCSGGSLEEHLASMA